MKSNKTIIIIALLIGYACGHVMGCYHERQTTVSKAVKVGSELKDSLLNRLK